MSDTPPRKRRSDDQTQISISLAKPLLGRVDKAAERDGRTRSNWIVRTLEKQLERDGIFEGASEETGADAGGPSSNAASRVFPDAPEPSGLNEDAATVKKKGPPLTRTRRALRDMQDRERGGGGGEGSPKR